MGLYEEPTPVSRIRQDRLTTAQLLAAAARDTDAVSVFEDGTGPGEAEVAILVVKGRANIEYLATLCARQGLLTPGKAVEG